MPVKAWGGGFRGFCRSFPPCIGRMEESWTYNGPLGGINNKPIDIQTL